MEEAYSELYQQFLRLRSLCLRQAALLHQLTAALQKQQGATAPNAEFNNLSIPASLCEKPQTLRAAPQRYVARCCDSLSPLLAEDMSQLCVDLPLPREEGGKLELKVAPLLTPDSSTCHGAFSSKSKDRGQTNPGGDRTVHTSKIPVSDGESRLLDFLSQPAGAMMSDVALQSHTCDFCQAIFPGDTTTKGEFIRHLHTHIS